MRERTGRGEKETPDTIQENKLYNSLSGSETHTVRVSLTTLEKYILELWQPIATCTHTRIIFRVRRSTCPTNTHMMTCTCVYIHVVYTHVLICKCTCIYMHMHMMPCTCVCKYCTWTVYVYTLNLGSTLWGDVALAGGRETGLESSLLRRPLLLWTEKWTADTPQSLVPHSLTYQCWGMGGGTHNEGEGRHMYTISDT